MEKLNFSKKKFLKLDLASRHKKCAFILKKIYENILLNMQKEDFSYYNKLLNWMELPPFFNNSLKKISDRYHFHLQNANIFLKEHNLLPSIRTKDSHAKEDFLENAIYLDNIRSAYNIGNILRTTEALRIGNVYFGKKTPFLDNKKLQKTSMGAFAIVPCYQNFDINNLPKPFIGLETSDDATKIFEFIFPENFTLILGNEEYGISNEMLNKIDHIIEIPMLGKKNSVNVASAFAICASEIRRQYFFNKLFSN